MADLIRHLLTEKDNATYCIMRLSLLLSVLVGLGLAIYSTIYQVPFDLESYGIGVAGLLSGAGLSIKLKSPDDAS
jgi:hypothetical protein